jgi:hypothetical protein
MIQLRLTSRETHILSLNGQEASNRHGVNRDFISLRMLSYSHYGVFLLLLVAFFFRVDIVAGIFMTQIIA